jgi:hypothetical protein
MPCFCIGLKESGMIYPEFGAGGAPRSRVRERCADDITNLPENGTAEMVVMLVLVLVLLLGAGG